MSLAIIGYSEYQWIQDIYKQSATIKFPIIQAVLAKQQEGNVFSDEDRNFFFVIHKFGFCQSFQRANNLEQSIKNYQFIAEPHFYQDRKLRWYNPDDICLEYFTNSALTNAQLSERTQMRMKVDEKDYCESSFYLKPITAELIEQGIFDLDIGNRFWNSTQDFLDFGIGVAAFDGDKCIGVCYSATLVENVAEIDIFVEAKYRKSGIGKDLVRFFVRQCQSKGIIANWDCFTNNISSFSLAKSAGFCSEHTYVFLTINK